MTKTYWNGQPTPARKVFVKVGKTVLDTWWCADLEGTIRKAVEVTYGGKISYLDNEDGSGWAKVTKRFGAPSARHRSLPDTSTVVKEDAS